MATDEIAYKLFFLLVFDRLQIDHLKIASLGKVTVFIEDVCDSAAHACCKITSCSAKDHNTPAGHVFATVIADTFHNSDGSAVTNREAFADHTPDICFS